MNNNFNLDLANTLKAIAFWEMKIENLRQALAENPNFDIYYTFKKINKNELQNNQLNCEKLRQFLSSQRIAASERECLHVINFASNNQGIMNFEAFVNAIFPQTNQSLRQNALNRPLQKKQNLQNPQEDVYIGSYSEQEVAKIFTQEILFYREIEELRKKLAQDHGQNIYEIFKVIDTQGLGFINFQRQFNISIIYIISMQLNLIK